MMYYLALMAYVLQLPDAKLGISIVGLSEALPYLTGFIMGYWADKTVHKVKTIIQTLLFRVGLYVIVGIYWFSTKPLGCCYGGFHQCLI
ncbi:hypothetical protein [Streptococcus dysgalactiae]|uniref:hypothetical protein n=1 Tax=Streptococcus dysgalactiae TaxID=1334 RepID=UPI001E2E9DF3|nr:hypothetical protein [Streptococcus dysgalactiae]